MSTLRTRILAALDSNPTAVAKALYVLHKRQTPDEQFSKSTQHLNGVGFNAADARILSELALHVIQGGTLNDRQLAEARSRIKKYVGQLEEVAMEKELAKWGKK